MEQEQGNNKWRKEIREKGDEWINYGRKRKEKLFRIKSNRKKILNNIMDN